MQTIATLFIISICDRAYSSQSCGTSNTYINTLLGQPIELEFPSDASSEKRYDITLTTCDTTYDTTLELGSFLLTGDWVAMMTCDGTCPGCYDGGKGEYLAFSGYTLDFSKQYQVKVSGGGSDHFTVTYQCEETASHGSCAYVRDNTDHQCFPSNSTSKKFCCNPDGKGRIATDTVESLISMIMIMFVVGDASAFIFGLYAIIGWLCSSCCCKRTGSKESNDIELETNGTKSTEAHEDITDKAQIRARWIHYFVSLVYDTVMCAVNAYFLIQMWKFTTAKDNNYLCYK
eukprot:413890_1